MYVIRYCVGIPSTDSKFNSSGDKFQSLTRPIYFILLSIIFCCYISILFVSLVHYTGYSLLRNTSEKNM